VYDVCDVPNKLCEHGLQRLVLQYMYTNHGVFPLSAIPVWVCLAIQGEKVCVKNLRKIGLLDNILKKKRDESRFFFSFQNSDLLQKDYNTEGYNTLQVPFMS